MTRSRFVGAGGLNHRNLHGQIGFDFRFWCFDIRILPQCSCDGFGQFLSERRIFNPFRFLRIRQVAAFNQDGRPLLSAQHADEPGMTHGPVLLAGGVEQRTVQAHGQPEVLFVKGVVGMRLARVVLVFAYEVGGQSGGREAIGFQAGQFVVGAAGVEMKAEENIRAGAVCQRDAFR